MRFRAYAVVIKQKGNTMNDIKLVEAPGRDPRHGVFRIEGLVPGMGTVIGTAMRRVLLSSVPGGGVVWMRIGGVMHEFSTVPGVREDVCEILQNVKRLVLRVCDEELHTLHLTAEGRDAVAADLVGDGGADVINGDLVLAHVAPGATLDLELWCRAGRDNDHDLPPMLAGQDKNRRIPAGLIAVDPVYSPVTRVMVQTEEHPDRDDLTLEICTNGGKTPKEAADWAACVLMGHFQTLAEMKLPEPKKEPLQPEGDSLLCLGLSKRAYNRLRRAKLHTVADIVDHTSEELYAIPDLGPSTILELQARLGAQGLYLRQTV